MDLVTQAIDWSQIRLEIQDKKLDSTQLEILNFAFQNVREELNKSQKKVVEDKPTNFNDIEMRDKLMALQVNNDRIKLLYEWIKIGKVNLKQFNMLIYYCS